VKWCDDVVVLDCGSTDGTVEVAHEVGVRVEVRPFDDWSTHLNWALENLHFAHPWVYNCDADEIVPDDLRGELLAVAAVGGSGNVEGKPGKWVIWTSGLSATAQSQPSSTPAQGSSGAACRDTTATPYFIN